MTQLEKIKKNNIYYRLLWAYVNSIFRKVYRRVEYHGAEKLPVNGSVILAPNHTNTFMDAMAVSFSVKNRKIFVARADIFKKPWMIKGLTFLKILPINRMRDGVKNLSKNEGINDMVVDALREEIYFCIFAEGTHRMKHGLLPLGKGICRIALQANANFGESKPLYIIPLGMEYGHFFRFCSSVLVQIGEPFNVTQFIENHSHLEEPELINTLKETIALQMKETILYIPDDQNHTGTLELCHLWSDRQRKRLGLPKKSLVNNFLAAKQTVSDISHLLQNQPEEAQKWIEEAEHFSKQRHKKGIRIPSMHRENPRASLCLKALLLIVGLPYFVVSALVSAPTTLLAEWICTKMKDEAFHNTVRFLIILFFYPLSLLLIFIPLLVAFPCCWALAGIALAVPSVFYVYYYLRLLRLFISDIKWMANKTLRLEFERFK